jgi:hypothetical protein
MGRKISVLLPQSVAKMLLESINDRCYSLCPAPLAVYRWPPAGSGPRFLFLVTDCLLTNPRRPNAPHSILMALIFTTPSMTSAGLT